MNQSNGRWQVRLFAFASSVTMIQTFVRFDKASKLFASIQPAKAAGICSIQLWYSDGDVPRKWVRLDHKGLDPCLSGFRP